MEGRNVNLEPKRGTTSSAWTRRLKRASPLVALVVIATPAVASPAAGADSARTRAPSPPIGCPSPGHVKPTVVLVHGAWADTSSWNGVVRSLQRAGYAVRAVANPLRNLTTDAESVADFLKTVSGPIVLVGHSYGGSVITNAAAGVPNVKALVYVDAAAPDVGETNGRLSGSDSALNKDPATLYDKVPYPGAPAGATDLYLKKSVFVRSFASDLPRHTAVRLWATQRAASTSAFTTPSKAAAWKTIPSWFFISTGDRIITPASERAMARRANSKITEVRGGSHLTLISHPDAVTSVIGSAACSVR
jgi:pimeloyl-ACP methyl ester carboxylesterase